MVQLTHHSEIELALSIASRKGGKLANVDTLILQLQAGEADGAIREGGPQEFHTLTVGSQHRDTHGWVVDGHILLGAIGGLLPRDLGDLHTGQWVGKTAVQHHIRADETIHGVVHLDHLCAGAWSREMAGSGQQQALAPTQIPSAWSVFPSSRYSFYSDYRKNNCLL